MILESEAIRKKNESFNEKQKIAENRAWIAMLKL
jgi:hypothetical protein